MNKVKDKFYKKLIKLFKNKLDLVDVWFYKNFIKMVWYGVESNLIIRIDDIIVNNDFIDWVKIIIVLRFFGIYYKKNMVKLLYVFELKYSIGKGNRIKNWMYYILKWWLYIRDDLFKNIDDLLDLILKCDIFKFKINRLSVCD